MGIEGQWFLQPGDIPAPFVYAVKLDGAGTATWSDNPSIVSAYRITANSLVIGWGPDGRIVLALSDPDAVVLSGAIETRFVYEADDCDEEDDFNAENDNAAHRSGDLGVVRDDASLVRSPRMLEVVALTAPIPPTAPEFFEAEPCDPVPSESA